MAIFTQKIHTALSNLENVPWIVLHKLGTVIGYHFLRYRSLPPETINIFPTFRCNLKCEMCFIKYAKVEDELEIKDWFHIIDSIKRFHPRIHISGGEPLVFKDIMKIIEYIKHNDLLLNITTNGTLLGEYAEDLVKYKVNHIDISIDGPEQIHDRLRGVKGTFARIIKGLEKISKLKKRYFPILKINSIINFNNPETMKEVVVLAAEYGVSAVQFIYPFYLTEDEVFRHRKFLNDVLGRSINYWCQAGRFKPAVRDFYEIGKILNELSRCKVITYVFPRFTSEQFKMYYNEPEEFRKVYPGKCRAMWHTATILPDGGLESCPDYVAGNIKRDDFFAIWNNQPMIELRKLIQEKKFFSVCRACCFYYQ
ncbi:MAG: radical SAM protein [bacterium]